MCRSLTSLLSDHLSQFLITYLLKPRTSQNESKRPKKIARQPERTQELKIGKIWNFLLGFVFKISGPNAQIWTFWVKKYSLSDLNEILPASYFEGADFKSDFRFQEF